MWNENEIPGIFKLVASRVKNLLRSGGVKGGWVGATALAPSSSLSKRLVTSPFQSFFSISILSWHAHVITFFFSFFFHNLFSHQVRGLTTLESVEKGGTLGESPTPPPANKTIDSTNSIYLKQDLYDHDDDHCLPLAKLARYASPCASFNGYSFDGHHSSPLPRRKQVRNISFFFLYLVLSLKYKIDWRQQEKQN